jgi:hypothetical protein
MAIPVGAKELMVKIAAYDSNPEKDHVSKIAVITDEVLETSEIVKVDRVRIMAMMTNEVSNVFQVNFILGGVDTAGKFYSNPVYRPALFSVSKQSDADWWNANIAGRWLYDFEEILRWVHEAGAVVQAGRDVWNEPYIQSYYEGEPPPPPPPKAIPSEFLPGVIPIGSKFEGPRS